MLSGLTLLRLKPPSLAHLAGMTAARTPQQATEPSTLTPQVWTIPALTEANSPAGGVARPSSLPPQQETKPSILTPQVCSTSALTQANRECPALVHLHPPFRKRQECCRHSSRHPRNQLTLGGVRLPRSSCLPTPHRLWGSPRQREDRSRLRPRSRGPRRYSLIPYDCDELPLTSQRFQRVEELCRSPHRRPDTGRRRSVNENRSGQAPGPERVVPSWALAGACPLNCSA